MTIDGGKLDIASSNRSGITLSGTLTMINNTSVWIEGKEYGISGGKLVMSGSETEFWAKGGTACFKNVDLSDGPQEHGFYIFPEVLTKRSADN